MSTLRFKTTINCGNCVNKIAPFLNEMNTIKSWSVDTNNEDKILTVEGNELLTVDEVVAVIEDTGFDIVILK